MWIERHLRRVSDGERRAIVDAALSGQRSRLFDRPGAQVEARGARVAPRASAPSARSPVPHPRSRTDLSSTDDPSASSRSLVIPAEIPLRRARFAFPAAQPSKQHGSGSGSMPEACGIPGAPGNSRRRIGRYEPSAHGCAPRMNTRASHGSEIAEMRRKSPERDQRVGPGREPLADVGAERVRREGVRLHLEGVRRVRARERGGGNQPHKPVGAGVDRPRAGDAVGAHDGGSLRDRPGERAGHQGHDRRHAERRRGLGSGHRSVRRVADAVEHARSQERRSARPQPPTRRRSTTDGRPGGDGSCARPSRGTGPRRDRGRRRSARPPA